MDAKQNNAASSSENRMGHPAACPDDRKKIIFDRNDGIFALITLVLGYLFLRFVSLVDPGAGIPLFTLCYLLGVSGYLRSAHHIPARGSLGWGIFLFAFSLLFLRGMPEMLTFPAIVFLCVLAAYWTLVTFGARLGGRLDGMLLGDLWNALMRLPFCNFDAVFCAVGSLFGRNSSAQQAPTAVCREEKTEKADGTVNSDVRPPQKNAAAHRLSPAVLVGGILTALLLPLVLLLLAEADAGFAKLVDWIWLRFAFSPEFLLRVFFSIPVSLYFFGLFSGARYRSHLGPDAKARAARQEARTRLGFAASAIPMSALLCVYLLFLFSQLPYFFSAFAGLLPGGFTYAEYARRGFFELLAVAAINLGLMLFTKRRTQKEIFGRKLLSGLLCAATLLLLGTAVRKLALYIEIFGLTRKRIWAAWAMVFVAAAVLLFLIDEFRPLPLMRWLALLFCGWFFLLCAVHTEPLTLRYNYALWQSGQIEEMDVWEGDALFAAPVLYEIGKETEDGTLKEDCKTRLTVAIYDANQQKENPVTGFTLQGWRVRKIIPQIETDLFLF